MLKSGIIFFLWFSIFVSSFAAQESVTKLVWLEPKIENFEMEAVKVLNFEGAEYRDQHLLPWYSVVNSLLKTPSEAVLNPVSWEIIKDNSIEDIKDLEYLSNDFLCNSNCGTDRGKIVCITSVLPLRKRNGHIERLNSFTIIYKPISSITKKSVSVTGFTAQSILAQGRWQKISISNDGIYKISFDELVRMGFNPNKIKIYGNGGIMLSPVFSSRTTDDLQEVPYYLETGNDGVFNSGDFLLFYGKAVTGQKFDDNTHTYSQVIHLYDRNAYYFITENDSPRKNIATKPVLENSANITRTFTDMQFIEPEVENLLHSGSEWYGEQLLPGNSKKYNFSFPNIATGSVANITVKVLGRSMSLGNTFSILYNGNPLGNLNIANSPNSSTSDFAKEGTFISTISNPTSDATIEIKFSAADAASLGWLDYITLNCRRTIKLTNDYLVFSDPLVANVDNTATFEVENANSKTLVMDITDINNAQFLPAMLSGSKLVFTDYSNSVRTYIAFNPNGNFQSPTHCGIVPNQNIHGQEAVDYLIITPSELKSEALRLAKMHQDDGLKTAVLTTEEVYNEYSSGTIDASAIRFCAKNFYDKGQKLKYLLLFGDGSYDNKGNETNEVSKIPAFECENSIGQSATYTSDDFYGELDDNEGPAGVNDFEDIAVGRLPLNSNTDAKNIVDKIIFYHQNIKKGNWKNNVVFLADDEDGNLHMRDSNDLTKKVESIHPEYVIHKIYLDAFKQLKLGSGATYPDAKKDFDKQLNDGAIMVNYTGHGGENALTGERVITYNDVVNYSNLKNLPLWITASCEFSRYDLHTMVTAGEYVLLNKNGGGIGLITTTRIVYASANKDFVNRFLDYMFNYDSNGERLRIGDIFKATKTAAAAGDNKRKFALLCDPALEIIYPKMKVKTSTVNGKSDYSTDTLKALDKVTIDGFTADFKGNLQNNFNGYIVATVFDKEVAKTCLENDPPQGGISNPFKFNTWENIIYSGKSEIKNGKFSFTFQIPKNINYSVGKGRISYYAYNDSTGDEANGDDRTIQIGGINGYMIADTLAPVINLFLNEPKQDPLLIFDSNPVLNVVLSDSSGILSSSNGLGHDITLTLDNSSKDVIVLNPYYFSQPTEIGEKGSIVYKLYGLSKGNHSLTLKAWDIFNNVGAKTLNFTVNDVYKPTNSEIITYPEVNNKNVIFKFDSASGSEISKVTAEVFDSEGNIVARINQTNNGQASLPTLVWDFRTISGRRADSGLYFYRIITEKSGKSTYSETQKMVIE